MYGSFICMSFYKNVNITNWAYVGNLIRPSMSINTNGSKETPESVVCQSRERSSVFYWHKFFLATLDLRTSVLAFGPPEEDERLSYLRALDVLDRHGNQLEGKFYEQIIFQFYLIVISSYFFLCFFLVASMILYLSLYNQLIRF